jgi:hypothetical protein
MKDIFKKIDIIGLKVELHIDKQSRSSTVLGEILFIIVIILTLIVTWILGNDVFFKLQPALVIQNQILTNRPKIILDKLTCPISLVMQLMHDNVSYYNERYFTFSVNLIIVNNNDSSIKTIPYELETCTYNHFPNIS